MDRRNFIVAGLCTIVYAIFPSLKPRPRFEESWWVPYAEWHQVKAYEFRWAEARTTSAGTTGSTRVTPASLKRLSP